MGGKFFRGGFRILKAGGVFFKSFFFFFQDTDGEKVGFKNFKLRLFL